MVLPRTFGGRSVRFGLPLQTALFVVGIVLSGASLLFAEPASAEDVRSPEVRAEMATVYGSFKRLWELSLHEDDFLSGKEDAEIKKLLTTLDGAFHSDKLSHSKYAEEPTYRFLLQSLGRVIEDAKYRFDEGKREYSLWRVKSLTNYCISCHTRIEGASFDFLGDKKILDEVKDPSERAQYLLASRQFDKAASAYLDIAMKSDVPYDRERALSQWLLIYTRVNPKPKQAKTELETYRKKMKGLTRKEIGELQLWLRGLNEWVVSESKGEKISPDSLLRKAKAKEDVVIGGGVIEYLRVTSLLHTELEKPLQPAEESKKLFQLAQAYSELSGYFSFELPELFLERAIKLQPNTDIARQSYKLYERIILAAYSGSGGTFLPDDIKLHAKELEDIAYGVVGVSGQV